MNKLTRAIVLLYCVPALLLAWHAASFAQDSLPSVRDGKVPQNLDELWLGYDPRPEPLEAQVAREWKEGDITCRVVLFTIGTFKGTKSRLAAFYAFPRSEKKLPALLHIHGGGQSAQLSEVISLARNGYAALSINWGGNRMSIGRDVYDGPNADWGAVDATHPPQRDPVNHFVTLAPNAFTLDTVESPRNSAWFLVLIAARRAITFLESQPEVDPERIGACGHSMGGKLTTDLAGIDRRVRVAVPSCGGTGDVPQEPPAPGRGKPGPSPLVLRCISDNPHIERIACPILYLGPTNDFNGHLDNLSTTWRSLPADRVRYSITPHMNHLHRPEFAVTQLLWFEQHLRGAFAVPQTPRIDLNLKTADGIPAVTVTPDAAKPVKSVDIYYSIDPQVETRFWRDALAVRKGEAWVAACPILSAEQPLLVFANVLYELPEPYRMTQKLAFFGISSKVISVRPEELQAAGVKATDKPSLLIDDGARGWHDWFQTNWDHPPLWTAWTRKVKDPKWRGPEGARLMLEIRSAGDNTLVLSFTSNSWGAFAKQPTGTYLVEKKLRASSAWQPVSVSLDDLLPTKVETPPLKTWQYLTELGLGAGGGTVFKNGTEVKLGNRTWAGPREFRNLRWEIGTRRAGMDKGMGTRE